MRKGDLTRLIRILGMLGSDHDGERAAAALAADRLVRGSGWTWWDLLAPARVSRPIRSQWMDPLTDRLAAADSRMRQLRSENARLQEEIRRLKRRLDLRTRPFRPAEDRPPAAP
ncbi:hypothetical protein [Inquilinus limosus]|uniref:Uncharacterized protein n=1 Tax=Inquilinus limosus MP06 TaxID=1398085 RepID=A0A0A0D7E9_9PROT|nr:hypothetical protein [Inquilinus limosus]KGM34010.1 hypothetical protein P409_12585 [Inquilinus limosus MP06]